MMPPEQGTTIPSNCPPNIILTNPSDGGAVHAEPSAPSINHMNPCSQIQDQNDPTPSRFSILRQYVRPITLKFEDVSYSINLSTNGSSCFNSKGSKLTKTVLNGVSGLVRPNELLAMLGPSGSGKTTLLTSLAGRLPGKVTGTITYNNQPFNSSIKRKTGFVSQDDVLYPHLTVLETLTYTALLRLPNKLTRQEKIEQAQMVVLDLGLNRCRNNIVGGPMLRGLSGGERKRVSIGLEMLVNPSLLLLDEPTSGLDSTSAHKIMGTLKGLARGGRTVVTTIHQPSSRLHRMFDKVLVLSDGWPIYSGPAGQVMEYFGSIGYTPGFNFMNPADFLLDLANGLVSERKQEDQLEFHSKLDHNDDHNSTKQILVSAYKKNLYPKLITEIRRNVQDPIRSSRSGTEDQWMTNWWEQFNVLLRRGLKERKHESYSGLRVFQVLSVAVLSGLLWWHSDTSHLQDQVGLLFFFSIFWGFFPMFNSIFTFPQERPMITKERSSGMYRLSSYYCAQIAGDLPMELILPTIFVTISYWMGGLKPSLVTFTLTLLIILLNVLVSQGLGLALGAILMNPKQAATLASVTMLVFLLAGGYYVQHMPLFISWMKYISFSHYCYKLLVGVQYSVNEVYNCGTKLPCRVMDFPAIKCLGLDNKLGDVAALTIMLVGYRVLAYVMLRLRQPH